MKTEQIKIYATLALISILLSSCWLIGPTIRGNGNVTEETRNLDGFDEIEVSLGMNVYITQGSPTNVKVIADNNLHDVIETDVDGDVLKVYVSANIREAREMKVMVTVEDITRVNVTSGGNVYSQNQIKAENMELKATLGSNMTMDLDAENLHAACSTGANIKLSGVARESELEGSSGANLKAEDLKSERCRMRASGGGNVYASVIKELEAKASGGGNIVYYGEPATADISSSGGGNINHR
ncbi:MAG TPA: head GIN domain-containing protein [Prolixibacteraceae bacterium]|nr:head GIN domain-containing protein [Prolixibacteraceae bacterium]